MSAPTGTQEAGEASPAVAAPSTPPTSPPPGPPAGSGRSAAEPAMRGVVEPIDREDLKLAGLVTLGLALIFGVLWNPWWVPAGDSEFFLVVGRNLFLGRGYEFAGRPVAQAPPGWPMMLAGLFHLTDKYLWVKLAQIVCMTGGLVASYFALRHVAGRRISAGSVLLAGLLSPLFPLTYWMHSEALFVLLSGLTALLAVRLGLHHRQGPLVAGALAAGLGLGVAGLVIVRWAGVANVMFLSGAALVSADGRSTRAWRLLGVVVVWLAAVGTFFAVRGVLTSGVMGGSSGTVATALAVSQPASGERQPAPAGVSGNIEYEAPTLVVRDGRSGRTMTEQWIERGLRLPQWPSWLLWQPVRVAGVLGWPGLAVDMGLGLLVLGLIGVAALRGGRSGWIWGGVLLFTVAMAMNWPGVNNRYLVPIAPFIIAGVLVGLGHCIAMGGLWSRAGRLLRWSFVASLLIVNGGLWLVDAWVFRSRTADDFYARYEAGIQLPLIEVGAHLMQVEDLRDNEVAASERYVNLHDRWDYPSSPRAMAWMTDRAVLTPPRVHTGVAVRPVQQWARDNHLRYYVHQNPTMPGRIWHFRLSPDMHRMITGFPPDQPRPQFELYGMYWPDPEVHEQRWLAPVPVEPLRGAELERVTRVVPHIRPLREREADEPRP